MKLLRFARAAVRRLTRLLTRPRRTRHRLDGMRVDTLTPAQRRRLRDNLRRLMSPKAA